jgi:UDP-glucose 4-epimerase
MSKILIFGGTGFLGQHLIKKIQRNYDFSYLTRNSKDFSNNSIKGDILQPDSYDYVLENTDIIINLVGQMVPDLEKFVETNIVGSLNLLNSAIKNNVKKIILVSTINVYGENKQFPSKETDSLFPLSNYGMIKMLNEKLYENFSNLYDLDITILRLSGVYGPGKIKGFFPQLISSVCNKDIILKPYNDGNQFRDLIYVDDAINGIIQSINYNSSGIEIFNISTGIRHSIKEMISLTKNISNSKIHVEYNPKKFDEECIWANNSKAKKLLDFNPVTSLENGIKKTLNL